MDELARALAGRLLLPTDADYARAKLASITLYDDRRPAAIAQCESAEDVQRCVEFAATQGIPVAARSGGHSYAGYSTPDGGLIIDLSRLNTVEVREDGTAVVGAGAQMAAVYEEIGRAGGMLSAGTCPTVGVAGLTLGGGIGVLGRKCGLASDQLVAATVVTVDGVHREVSGADDLFWALRGAGGGNFGVVTSFTFRTTPAEPLTVWTLDYSRDARPAMLQAWQEWQAEVPDEMWSQCRMGTPDVVSQVGGCLVGTDTSLIDDLARRIGTPPRERRQRELDFRATMRHYAYRNEVRAAFGSVSRMLTGPMDPRALGDLVTSEPEMFCLIDSFGGAISRGEGSFPHRDAIASIQVTNQVTTTIEAARRELAPVREQLGKWFGVNGFVNYIDPEMPDWRQAYYGANAPRLAAIARRHDPDGVFAFPQAI